MMKAVNMKGYKFGSGSYKFTMNGFGMFDTETEEFVSFDGKIPYVLRTKKLTEICIEGKWPEKLKRVKHI